MPFFNKNYVSNMKSFLNRVIPWEQKLIDGGIEIIKFYFSLSKDQQKRRMKARKYSELKYWKLSPNDERIVTKWDAFTLYKEQMFEKTSPDFSPWIAINANNKIWVHHLEKWSRFGASGPKISAQIQPV